MKKTFKFAALLLCTVAVAASCNKNNLEEPVPAEGKMVTLTCVISPDSRVSIDATGKTQWEVGDEIHIHTGHNRSGEATTVTLTAADISSDGKSATITFEALKPYDFSSWGTGYATYYAAYPADATANPEGCYCRNYFSDTNKPLMAACDNEGVFEFHNLCGVITFSVTGDYDSYVLSGNMDETVAYGTYAVEILPGSQHYSYVSSSNPTNGTHDPKTLVSGSVTSGKTISVFLPNGTNFTQGFNIKFKKGGEIVKIAKTTTAVDVARNKLLALGDITSKLENYSAPTTDTHKSAITGATDLSSANGSANCYVLSAAGAYKIPVVKGNSSTSAGNVFGVKLIWESYNNSEEVTANSVIEQIDYDGPENYIYFKTPSTLKKGNAVIAALDSEQNVIWSWHIWIPETAITSATYSLGEKQLMDRFLGALTADMGLGLGYQWGRKDPFPGASAIASDASPMSSAGMAISVVHDDAAAPSTVAGAIANPNVLYTANNSAWYSETDDGLWSGTKTIYDPCPAGYRVPATEDVPGLFASDLSETVGWTQDNTNMCFGIGDPVTVFPLSGYVDDYSSKFGYAYVSKRVAIWSANGSGSKASAVDIRYDKDPVVHKVATPAKSRVGYIRCVAE